MVPGGSAHCPRNSEKCVLVERRPLHLAWGTRHAYVLEPDFPPVTITAFITCRPATSFTPSCENGLRCSQPPVSGTVIGPVRSRPLNSRRNVPPGPLQATCMSMRYVPASLTSTV